MFQALHCQLQAELGPDSEKDIFVLIVDRCNTGAHTVDDVERSGKWRTRLSSKAAPFVPKVSPQPLLTGHDASTHDLLGQTFVDLRANMAPVNDCPAMPHWSDAMSFSTAVDDEEEEEDTISTEDSNLPPTSSLPVKHTFIHYADSPPPGALSRCASAPALLVNKAVHPVDEDNTVSEQTRLGKAMAHENGECRPCAFFLYKEDGCHWGDSCSFCHLCPKGEIKVRRKMLRYATQRAERLQAKSEKQAQTRVLLLQEQV
mmetsp:Transcript_143/g.444  ORF Transcript_143/g.444 Transcript_143/m.444 type:complete len:259 (-) Transcript_143:49-825(-)